MILERKNCKKISSWNLNFDEIIRFLIKWALLVYKMGNFSLPREIEKMIVAFNFKTMLLQNVHVKMLFVYFITCSFIQ